MLRHKADGRTLAYLAFAMTLSIVQWNLTSWHPLLYGLSLFLAITVAVISHNVNHVSLWRSRALNQVTSYVIALYYGHPAVAWVPTHNQIHHKLNNGPGDSSRAPKLFKRNHLAALLIYPSLTGIAQQTDIKGYFACAWKKNRPAFYWALSEYVVFVAIMAGLFLLNWRKALLYFVIPQQVALFVIQVFNYIQHVETETGSTWNHSRNFVSPVLNALLFNNGFHTVHHQAPGLHWSELPSRHAQVAPNIKPELLQSSLWGYLARTFLLPQRARTAAAS